MKITLHKKLALASLLVFSSFMPIQTKQNTAYNELAERYQTTCKFSDSNPEKKAVLQKLLAECDEYLDILPTTKKSVTALGEAAFCAVLAYYFLSADYSKEESYTQSEPNGIALSVNPLVKATSSLTFTDYTTKRTLLNTLIGALCAGYAAQYSAQFIQNVINSLKVSDLCSLTQDQLFLKDLLLIYEE